MASASAAVYGISAFDSDLKLHGRRSYRMNGPDLIQSAIPVKAPNCWTRPMRTRRERAAAIPLPRLCRGAATRSTDLAGFYPQPRHVALIAVREAG